MPRTAKTTAKKRMKATKTKTAARKKVALARASATRRSKRTAPSARHAWHAASAPARHADAIAVLKHDHRQLLPLLVELKEATGARRNRLYEQVEEMLKTHTSVEEEIFYPAFRDAAQSEDDRRKYHEATEEHRAADMVLREVGSASEDDVFAARAKVLHELVRHHAQEEEESMFPRARELFPPGELKQLGDEIRARKQTLAQRSGPLSAVAALFSR